MTTALDELRPHVQAQLRARGVVGCEITRPAARWLLAMDDGSTVSLLFGGGGAGTVVDELELVLGGRALSPAERSEQPLRRELN